MKKSGKFTMRTIAAFLCVTVWASSLPMQAFAEETTNDPQPPSLEASDRLNEEQEVREDQEPEQRESKIVSEIEDKRTETTKHFMTVDHTMIATTYKNPVHYEKDGQWEQIDNSLELHTDTSQGDVYQNKASNVGVKIAKFSDSDNLITITKDEFALSWNLNDYTLPQEENNNSDQPTSEPEAEQSPTDDNDAESAINEADLSTASSTEEKQMGNDAETSTSPPSPGFVAPKNEAAESQALTSGTSQNAEESPAPAQQAVEFQLQTAQESQETENLPTLFSAEPVEENPTTQEDIHAYNMKMASVPNMRSQGIYEDILEDIDIQYIIYSNIIKENIIVKNKEAAAQLPLSFTINHSGMRIRQEEDGTLSLYTASNPDDVVFIFAAPFMTDANQKSSNGVAYQLTQGETEDQSILTVMPDMEWLNAADRVYPVVIDPYTETSKRNDDMADTYVASNDPNNDGLSGYGSFLVGRNSADGTCRGFIKLETLPILDPGDIVYYGALYVTQYEFSAVGEQSFRMEAHEPLANWPYGVTWNTQPSHSNTVIDFDTITPLTTSNGITYVEPRYVDITKLVRKWYNTPSSNYGVVLKSNDESHYAVARFFTSNYVFGSESQLNSEQYPFGFFYYGNTSGLEDYWSFHSQSLGRSGTGNINDFNGNLVYIHDDASTSGVRMPVGISHVYNLTDHKKSSRFGNGWRLSVMQQFGGAGTKENPYVYTDADGTRHYFLKDDNVWKDQDGLGLTYESISEGELKHKIILKDDTVLKFDQWGYLRRTIDSNQNTISYNYSPHNAGNYLSTVTDGAGHLLDLYYTANHERLDYLIDQAGRKIYYAYNSSGDLTSITYPDGTKTTFTYTSHRLTSVTSPSGYKVEYSYLTDMNVPRVSKVVEKGGSATGQSMNISYKGINTTVVEDCGLDGNLSTKSDNIITTFNFDNFGRPHDVYDQDGNANSYEYYTAKRGDDTPFEINNNRLNSVGSMQKTVINLVSDSSFELDDGNWSKISMDAGMSFTTARDTSAYYLGKTSMKVNKTTNFSTGGIGSGMISVTAGATYTLSGYVKTNSIGTGADCGAGLLLCLYSSSTLADLRTQPSSERVTGTTDPNVNNGWKRLSVTFTVPSNVTAVKVVGAIYNTTGTAWFDCIQLEKGDVANKYNLLQNSSFEKAGTGNIPYEWSAQYMESSDARISYTGTRDGSFAYRMTGNVGNWKDFYQLIPLSGKEGDVFVLGCWAKADALPDLKNSEFQIYAKINYTTGEPRRVYFDFDPYQSDWQYISGVVSTDDNDPTTNRTYDYIEVNIIYGHNQNTAYFDGVQLIKDDSQSYVYDNEGNLKATDSAAQSSSFDYEKNNNLSKIVSPTGSSFEYSYDYRNDLIQAQSSSGIEYKLVNDAFGNPGISYTKGGNYSGAVTSGRTYYIRQKTSGKYLEAEGDPNTNQANVRQNVFTGEARQKWKVVNCGNGYYNFVNMGSSSGKVMEVYGAYDTNGANVSLYTNNQSDAQKFRLKVVSDGSYQIAAKCSNDEKVLTNQGGYTTPSNIDIRGINGEHNDQSWYFEPADRDTSISSPSADKTYMIRGRESGQYWGLEKNAVIEGNVIWQMYRNNELTSGIPTTNQTFIFTPVPNEANYYYISLYGGFGMVLQLSNKMAGDYHRIEIAEKDSSDIQKFKVTKNSNGTFRITPKNYPNNAMQMVWGPYSNEQSVLNAPYTANAQNQQWILEEYSQVIETSQSFTADNSQLSYVSDSRYNFIMYDYDSKNRLLVKETDQNGKETNYTYDPNTDQLLTVSKDVTNGSNQQTITAAYAYQNDLLKTITHNGFNYSFNYDAFGNTTSVKVGNQTLTTNSYLTNNGPLSLSTYGNGQTVGYTYDKYGRAIEKKYNGTVYFKNQYDSFGSLLRYQDLLNNQTIRYQYDMIGRLTEMENTNGVQTTYQYDEKNRLNAFTNVLPGNTTKTEFIYGDGSAAKPNIDQIYDLKLNGTAAVSYQYDELGRLSAKTLPTSTPFSTQYGYLPGHWEGSTTTLVKSVKNGNQEIAYTYDKVGNIQTISENGVLKAKYYYDELNQLIRENNRYLEQTITYEYDAGGNLLRKKEYDYTTLTFLSGKQPTKEIVYAYADSNWKDKLTSFNGQAITYDAIGNPLTYRDGMSFTWKYGRQLATMSGNGDTVSYMYDSNGIRTSKTINGVKTSFYYDGNGQLIRSDDGNVKVDYLYDQSGSPFGFKYNGSLYYYIKSVQGDIIGILDQSGSKVVDYVYDSWGKLQSISGSAKDTVGVYNALRYRGYYYDTETGLYYVANRYYDPEIGRWINADSAIASMNDSIQGYNMFAYCFNNPVNMSDNSGNWPQWVKDAANWVNDNIIQPVVKFVDDIVEDIKNYDFYNKSEKKVLESNYFSSYKGVPVIRTGGDRSGSFGAIFLTRETNNRKNPEDVVRHEYGHTKQLKQLGVINYALCVGVPSWQQWGSGEYYSKSWEITADIYGGVQSRKHLQSDIDAGFVYLEASKIIGPLVWIFIE